MARFFSIATEVDGRRYTGDWTLLMGNRICVRSAYGSETVDIGRGKPELAAAKTLAQIVRTYHRKRDQDRARQEREARRLARTRA